MTFEEPSFIGIWHVAEQEFRSSSGWKREYDFEHKEWSIAFFPDGTYDEILRLASEPHKTGMWSLDAQTGVISIRNDETSKFVQKCVFDTSEDVWGDAYLYYFDGTQNIRPDIRSIVEHHAHTRIKLVLRAR